jgi:hypothetical protein
MRAVAVGNENALRERLGRPPMTREERVAFEAGHREASRQMAEYVFSNDLAVFRDYTRKDRVMLARTLAILGAIPDWAAPK